ncbi:hypothetical protein TKK_0018865 [Trichogramma kaykai]|uniref:SprT-like domain-containing protein n=1 Tax=Trichogramma kaykai TaxID=54128 RepID=A0ABD2VWD2_9HYME
MNYQTLPVRSLPACMQERIVEKIYLKPNDLDCFDRINIVCFGGLLDPLDIIMCECPAKDLSKLHYDKITKRCNICFHRELKTLLTPKNFFHVYMHQLIHAYLYQHRRCDHGRYDFKDHLNRISLIMHKVYFPEDNDKIIECVSNSNSWDNYCRVLNISPNLLKSIEPIIDTPVNKNNIVSSSSNFASFPITTTLTNSHGDKIVSITATKQRTVIVIHQD